MCLYRLKLVMGKYYFKIFGDFCYQNIVYISNAE